MSSAKGSTFERSICVELSLWFSNGQNDSIFWRSAGSGARSTTRFKKGKKTANSEGDLMCLDPIGQPLIQTLTIECKKGYNKHTLHDLLDSPKTAAAQAYEAFIGQARASHEQAGSLSWLLLTKRDRRDCICTTESSFYSLLMRESTQDYGLANIYYKKIKSWLTVFKLDDFLTHTKPDHIINIYNEKVSNLSKKK